MSVGSNVVKCVGLGNDRQVDGYASIDIERGARLALVHVVSNTVETSGLAISLVAERPQVVPTVSSKVVVLYISSVISEHPRVLPRGRLAYIVFTGYFV